MFHAEQYTNGEKLGRYFELAQYHKDFDTMIAIEKRLTELLVLYPDVSNDFLFVRGRNQVRQQLGMEEVRI